MTTTSGLIGEASGSKVAAVFASEDRARQVAAQLPATLGLPQTQVRLVTPHDRHPGRKLEPENQGIVRTMIRAHAWLGALGAIVGALVFAVMWALGVGMVVNAAKAAAFACVVFGTFAGLFLGGLVSLRPDHDIYINRVLEALKDDQCAVVVHALSHEQSESARKELEAMGGAVVSTLLS